jgi:hypothetical protein
MADEHRKPEWFAPDHVIPGRIPRHGELLFEFHIPRTNTFWRVDLRDHGVYGIEAQFFNPIDLEKARTFRTPVRDGDRVWSPRELAIQWAEDERKAMERETW